MHYSQTCSVSYTSKATFGNRLLLPSVYVALQQQNCYTYIFIHSMKKLNLFHSSLRAPTSRHVEKTSYFYGQAVLKSCVGLQWTVYVKHFTYRNWTFSIYICIICTHPLYTLIQVVRVFMLNPVSGFVGHVLKPFCLFLPVLQIPWLNAK